MIAIAYTYLRMDVFVEGEQLEGLIVNLGGKLPRGAEDERT